MIVKKYKVKKWLKGKKRRSIVIVFLFCIVVFQVRLFEGANDNVINDKVINDNVINDSVINSDVINSNDIDNNDIKHSIIQSEEVINGEDQTENVIISDNQVDDSPVSSDESISEEPVTYNYHDQVLEVTFQQEGIVYVYEFAQVGDNQLMSLSKTGFTLEDKDYFTTSKSDYVGPMIVKEMNGSDATEQFTGGWHSFEDKSPTAKTVEIQLFVDDEPVLVESFGEAKRIHLVVKNQIAAYNGSLLDCAVQETVVYTIHEMQIDVSVTIEALKEIEIYRYYGIQLLEAEWANNILFRYEDGSASEYSSDINIQSLTVDSPNSVTSICVLNRDLLTSFNAWLDRDTPLLQGQYLGANQPWAFNLSYNSERNKSYFNIINGKVLSLLVGDSIGISGGYYYQ